MNEYPAFGLRVAFLLPEVPSRPIGAAKVVYQYADHLSTRGHHVALIHPESSLLAGLRSRNDTDRSLFTSADCTSCAHKGSRSVNPLRHGDAPHPWYRTRPEVAHLLVPELAEGWLAGPYDVTVATHLSTLQYLESYSDAAGLKMYFLQDYESYFLGSLREQKTAFDRLSGTWPVIGASEAIRRLVLSATRRSCQVVPCGIDTRVFCTRVAVDSEERTLIGFPARPERTKRTTDAIRALTLARPRMPQDVRYWCFGWERLGAIPDWVTQHVAIDDESLGRLYNRTTVFLVPSEIEGFGLPGAEAMACGAALVSTRNGGVDSYARDQETAILCPPRDTEGMASAIASLLADTHRRFALASAGRDSVLPLSKARSAQAFERAVLSEYRQSVGPKSDAAERRH